MTGKHDVAIYSPASSVFFGGAGLLANREGELVRGEAGVAQGGGRELQMSLLARGLAGEGLRTALIVWPIEETGAQADAGPDLVQRPGYAGAGRTGNLREAGHIWRALRGADAAAYVFRGAGPQLMVGAAFCRLHRRRLVFSAASDLDFDFAREDRTRTHLITYRAALRRADLLIAQRAQQAELARAAGMRSIELIPSFAEPAEPSEAKPEAFLWIGRVVDYKRPLEYVRLAEALPEVRFRMVWFPTNETRPELIAELQSAGDRLANLELVGQTPRHRLLDLIGRSYAVVSTSRAIEGMPNTFLEAWAREVPVISLDYDPDGRIEAQGLGLVVRSADELRDAAARVAGDPELRSEMGKRARVHVESVHSPDAVSARWARVIRELLG